MGKVVSMKGNQHAKGRNRKAPTFTLKSGTETLLTTKFERIARAVAESYFADVKSVALYDNTQRRVVARWNYGHRQPLRGQK